MPTERPRYMLTATDEIAAAIERASARWPEDAGRPAQLLRRLIAAGDAAAADEDGRALQARRDAIVATSGMFPGLYPTNYLHDLRQDWDE